VPVHANVYGLVPPAGVISIAPVEAPKHNTLVWTEVNVTAAAGWVIVNGYDTDVQLLASVTITEYDPAARPVWSSAPATTPVPVHANVYGDVPPAGVISIAPVEAPKHNTLVWTEVNVTAAAGWVMVNGYDTDVQLLASVTITEYDPAARPVWSSDAAATPAPIHA
jgi:hypothetical protein